METVIGYSLWPYLLIGVAAMLAYLPSLSGEFILDDRPLIQYNPYITQLHSIPSYLYQEDGVTNNTNADSYHTGYYRPLINLSYWIDYKLWGMNASGFRATNLILHMLCGALFFRFLLIFEKKRNIALVVCLLFILHPVNTEAVSWITSRNNIIVTLFSLLSFILYRKAHQTTSQWPLVLSILCFALALFSKEFGVMLFPVLVLYREMMGKSKNEHGGKGLLTWYIPFVLVLLFYFVLRQNATHSWLSPEGAERFFRSVFFAPYLFFMNVKLLLVPYGLHSFVVKYPKSYIDPVALFGIAFSVLSAFFIWKHRRNSILLFSLVSFVLALFPIMNVISTSSMSLISMRWLYFPMVFLGPLGCLAIEKLSHASKALKTIGLSLVLAYFGVYSYGLNHGLWKNEDTFFPKEIHEFGSSYYAYGYALKHVEHKDFENAERYFKIAIDGYHHKKAAAYLKYAELLNGQGRFEDLITLLEQDERLPEKRRERGQWCSYLGTAYFELGKKTKAIEYYQKAVSCSPTNSLFLANLGGAYGSIRAYSKSVDVLQKALNLDPESLPIRKNLVQTYIRLEKYREAMDILKQIDPKTLRNDKKLRFFYSKAKEKMKKLER